MAISCTSRRSVAALLAATVSGGFLASAGLWSAPPARATCLSAFGIGNSADCSSTLFGIAFALGDGAQAHAEGFFGASFAIGDSASATTRDAFTLASAAEVTRRP